MIMPKVLLRKEFLFAMLRAMDYRYFGLLSFAVLVCGLTFIVLRWPQGKHVTFSGHVAVAKHKIVYYIALFAVALPLLVLFFVKWFAPAFNLPIWFSVSLIISAVAQQACAFVPEVGGWKTRCHAILTGISALSLLPPLTFILASDHIPAIGRAVTFISLLCMASIITLLAIKRGDRYYLILQAVYYTAFFAPVLLISYVL
jgi:hypothetical protein